MHVLKKIIAVFLLFNFFTINITNSKELQNIAIPYFNNQIDLPELNEYRTKLSESLINNLSKYPDIRIIEQEKVNSVLNQYNLGDKGHIKPEEAIKLGKYLGLEYVVLGSLSKSGSTYYIGINLIDVKSSNVIMKKSFMFTKEGIFKSTNYFALLTADNLGEEIPQKEFDDSINEMDSYDPNKSLEAQIVSGLIAFSIIACFIALVLKNRPDTTLS